MKKYAHLILGGTFDHFHRGHKTLIDKALAIGKRITIGIARKNLYEKKLLSETIEGYGERKKSVQDYLRKKKMLVNVIMIPISDIFGTSLMDESIDAILVTEMTYENAVIINNLRKKKGFVPLDIVKVPLVRSPDGEVITSERIRSGEIDREGNSFQRKTLSLPDSLREKLRKPLGMVIKGRENELLKTARRVARLMLRLKPVIVITVGDIITNSLMEIGFNPDVKIMDYRTRRQKIHPKGVTATKIYKTYINKPGTISKEAMDIVYEAIHPKGVRSTETVVVDGEEDLLALPAILFAPLKSVVLYGQIDFGVVLVEVTEDVKRTVGKILRQFHS